jgi:hypothetical protein
MKEAGTFLECKLILDFFLERTGILKKKRLWMRNEKWLRLRKPEKVGNHRLLFESK